MTSTNDTDITLTCIFGNGFDLALGLKTRFDDFVNWKYLGMYKDYPPTREGGVVCNRLADKIAFDIIDRGEKTWADAEMSFARLDGEVLGNVPDEFLRPGARGREQGTEDRAKNFKTLFMDFSAELRTYLTEQDAVVDAITEARWKEAGRGLLENVFNRVDEMFRLETRQVSSVTINFITLNYTRTLGKMVQTGMTHRVRRTSGGRTVAVKVGEVLSAHGTLADEIVLPDGKKEKKEGRIIFGIDDIKDVADSVVRESCADYFLKDNEAFADASGRRVEGFGLLENSDYALLFGVACGKSDAEWWRKLHSETFDERGRLRLVYCSYNNKVKGFEPRIGEEGRKICRTVFFGSVAAPEVEASMQTYWQRMGAFEGDDVLGFAKIRADVAGKIKTNGDPIAKADNPERRRREFSSYLRKKGASGDAFAKTLSERAMKNAARPKIKVAELAAGDFENMLTDDAARKRVYESRLRKFLTNEKRDDFTSDMFAWLENHADKLAEDVLYAMGWLRERGDGDVVVKDVAKAVGLYEKAAERGNLDVQLVLGRMYCYGMGVEKNVAKAVEWYTKAADRRHPFAIYELKRMAKEGDKAAVASIERTAKQGHAWAQIALGDMYRRGEGVGKDATKAVEWYTKAAEQGPNIAIRNLEEMAAEGYKEAKKALERIRKDKGE